MFGDLQCSFFFLKTDSHMPFVCCARREFPRFLCLFLVVNHYLHVFQIPRSCLAKTNPETSVMVCMSVLVIRIK